MQVAVTENSAPPPRSGQPPRPGQPPRGDTGGPGRHRISRSLASACLTGGLVAGSAVAAFALLGANHTPAASHLQPQAGAAAAPNVPASASSNSGGQPGRVVLRPVQGPRLAGHVRQPGGVVRVLRHVPAADADRFPVVRAADQGAALAGSAVVYAPVV